MYILNDSHFKLNVVRIINITRKYNWIYYKILILDKPAKFSEKSVKGPLNSNYKSQTPLLQSKVNNTASIDKNDSQSVLTISSNVIQSMIIC